MTQRKDGGPAFPITDEDTVVLVNGNRHQGWPGMTLRDYFAGQALAALLAGRLADIDHAALVGASACYRIADAMIAARDA